MTTNKFTVVALVATMVLASVAVAQRGGGDGGQRRGGGDGGMQRGGMQRGGGGMQRGGMGGGMQSEVSLLSRPDVQVDIKLTAEQKTKLEAYREEESADRQKQMEEFRNNRESGGSFDRDSIMALFEKARKESEAKVKAIVTKAQWIRLGEIKIRMMGARTLMNEDIQKQLGMKATQKLEINKLNDSLNAANQQIMMKMRDTNVDREALMAEVEKNNKILEGELDKILTADQRKKFTEMKGKPFKQDMEYRPERGGSGFGGGGTRGGGGGTRGGGGGGG